MTGISPPTVSLIVPTLERPDFLLRLIRFYQASRFTGKILIGDGGNTSRVQQTKVALRHAAPGLDIGYWHFPGAGVAQVVRELSSEVSTPYVALVADDDFLVPSALEKCAAFLKNNSDYSAAHGSGILITLASTGAHGKIARCGYYPQPQREETSAAQRLVAHLGNYSVSLFSLHRIEIWRKMFSATKDVRDVSFGAELLPCCLSVVLGKTKQLDGLMLVRQAHSRRYHLPNVHDWITDEAWCPSYAIAYESLAKEISHQDCVSLNQARAEVKRGFSMYLQNIQKRRAAHNITLWRDRIRRIPSAPFIWRWAQRMMPGSEFSLPKLLNPSSPHHTDFLKIRDAITQSPDIII